MSDSDLREEFADHLKDDLAHPPERHRQNEETMEREGAIWKAVNGLGRRVSDLEGWQSQVKGVLAVIALLLLAFGGTLLLLVLTRK